MDQAISALPAHVDPRGRGGRESTMGDKNPRYDGRMVFLPNVSLLRPGDIILTSTMESQDERSLDISRRVREAAGSSFSHVLICTSPPTFAEAGSDGVSSLSLANCFVHAIENVRAFRHPDETVARRAASHAQMGVGREYSLRQARQSVLPVGTGKATAGDDGTFCSAYVAQAFAMAGAEEFAAVSVERTTPATIEKIEGLADITSVIFQRALAPRNVEAMTALDGDYAPTPSSPQTETFQRYAKAALPEAERLVNMFPEAGLERQTTYFGMLLLILNADAYTLKIAEGRHLDFLRAITELDDALATQQADGAIERFFADIVASDNRQMERDLRESFSATPDIDVHALRSQYDARERSLVERQRALMSMSVGRKWQSIDAHCSMQEESIAFASRMQKALQEILTRLGDPG